VITVKINAVQVLALSCFGVLAGVWIKKRLPVLDRLNIPASVLGGLIYAIITLALRDRYVNFDMDLVLRDILMVAFFATIGMSASLQLLRVGGQQVVIFFLIATVGAVLQNALGLGFARLFGLNPLLGIIAGSVSLTGGPATALAFGVDFEKRFGVGGAVPLGIAAAMFGIVAGGLLGGPVGGRLIERFGLKRGASGHDTLTPAEAVVYPGPPPAVEPTPMHDESESEQSPLFRTVAAIAAAMGVGTLVSLAFERAGLVMPATVGAMLAGALLRNLDDQFHFAGLSQHGSQRQTDTVGSIALNIFIVMALLTLRLWELVNLALPMLAILLAQIALVWMMALAVFRLMGRDYESAVMAGGFCGFMLGTTANAMACLEVLSSKYGPAPRAYIVVPIVGAFLIDFTNALVITAMANFFR